MPRHINRMRNMATPPPAVTAACCLALVVFLARSAAPPAALTGETVVLLHGLGRTSCSMLLLKYRLQQAGYHVLSKRYASTRGTVADHVAWLDGVVAQCTLETAVKIHFVTHSLGGIVVRRYLENHRLPNLGRVVMLAPPNRGSEIADHLKDWKLYQAAMGPSGQELGTDDASTPNLLGPAAFEMGVIAGRRSFNPLMSRLIPGADDGKVAVRRTKVDGMKDFLVVDHSHTFIMNAPLVADEVVCFLAKGSFSHADAR